MKFYKYQTKLQAFTLPEVLVTLVVLGMIFVILMPGIINNIRDTQYDSPNKEISSILKQVSMSLISNDEMTGYSSTPKFFDVAKQYMNIEKVCESDLSDCFAETFEIEGTKKNLSAYSNAAALGKDWGTKNIGFVLSNGMTGILAYNPNCYGDMESQKLCFAVLYDLNGKALTNSYTGVNGKSDLGTYNASFTGDAACDIMVQGDNLLATGPDRDEEECITKVQSLCTKIYGTCSCNNNNCSF